MSNSEPGISTVFSEVLEWCQERIVYIAVIGGSIGVFIFIAICCCCCCLLTFRVFKALHRQRRMERVVMDNRSYLENKNEMIGKIDEVEKQKYETCYFKQYIDSQNNIDETYSDSDDSDSNSDEKLEKDDSNESSSGSNDSISDDEIERIRKNEIKKPLPKLKVNKKEKEKKKTRRKSKKGTKKETKIESIELLDNNFSEKKGEHSKKNKKRVIEEKSENEINLEKKKVVEPDISEEVNMVPNSKLSKLKALTDKIRIMKENNEENVNSDINSEERISVKDEGEKIIDNETPNKEKTIEKPELKEKMQRVMRMARMIGKMKASKKPSKMSLMMNKLIEAKRKEKEEELKKEREKIRSEKIKKRRIVEDTRFTPNFQRAIRLALLTRRLNESSKSGFTPKPALKLSKEEIQKRKEDEERKKAEEEEKKRKEEEEKKNKEKELERKKKEYEKFLSEDPSIISNEEELDLESVLKSPTLNLSDDETDTLDFEEEYLKDDGEKRVDVSEINELTSMLDENLEDLELPETPKTPPFISDAVEMREKERKLSVMKSQLKSMKNEQSMSNLLIASPIAGRKSTDDFDSFEQKSFRSDDFEFDI